MSGVNVFENGIGYLHRALGLYMNGTGYFLAYLICVLFIMLKGSKKERQLFLPSAVVLLVTVYNPFVPLILDRIFDVNNEYYRLFWIAPVIVLVPYALVKFISGAKTAGQRTVFLLLSVALLIVGGNYVYAQGINIASNPYKIPDELIEISSKIHGDSDSEYVKAFFEYEYNMEIRQYDPKILLSVDREDYLRAIAYDLTYDLTHDDNRPAFKILAPLVRNQDIDMEEFKNALEMTGTEYVVLTKGHPRTAYVKQAGLYLIGETATHMIFKYDLKEKPEYSLVDYSDMDHKLSFRRLK